MHTALMKKYIFHIILMTDTFTSININAWEYQEDTNKWINLDATDNQGKNGFGRMT